MQVVRISDKDGVPIGGTSAALDVNLKSGSIPAGTAAIGSTKDNGPAWTVVRTYTTSADMSTAAAITAAPTAGQKIYADDILVSAAVAMEYSIQMETSANVLASVFVPANGTVQITMRDGIKGDAADKKLFGKASVAGNVRITACYHSEA